MRSRYFAYEGNVDEEVGPKVDVEIKIWISPTGGSSVDNCIRFAANVEVWKTKEVCFPSNLKK